MLTKPVGPESLKVRWESALHTEMFTALFRAITGYRLEAAFQGGESLYNVLNKFSGNEVAHIWKVLEQSGCPSNVLPSVIINPATNNPQHWYLFRNFENPDRQRGEFMVTVDYDKKLDRYSNPQTRDRIVPLDGTQAIAIYGITPPKTSSI